MRGFKVVEATNFVINCMGKMWEREESVMLPTFLYWLTGWMLVSFPKQKVKEGKGRVIKSTLNTSAYYALGTAK